MLLKRNSIELQKFSCFRIISIHTQRMAKHEKKNEHSVLIFFKYFLPITIFLRKSVK